MLIGLANLEGGRGRFAHVYQLNELNPGDERVSLADDVTANIGVRRKALR